MNLVPEYSFPLFFPNNFHSVLPLTTLQSDLAQLFDSLMGDNVSGSTRSLYQLGILWHPGEALLHVMSKCGLNSVMFCVTWPFQGALFLYLPALTFSSAHLQSSTSMECFHCSFWAPPSSLPSHTWLLITRPSHLKGELLGWWLSRSATNYLPSIVFFFNGWRWITVGEIEGCWLDHGQMQIINLHI